MASKLRNYVHSFIEDRAYGFWPFDETQGLAALISAIAVAKATHIFWGCLFGLTVLAFLILWKRAEGGRAEYMRLSFIRYIQRTYWYNPATTDWSYRKFEPREEDPC